MVAEGTDIRTVAGRLGHKDPAVTLGIYSHFVKERDKVAAGAVTRLLRPSLNPPPRKTRFHLLGVNPGLSI